MILCMILVVPTMVTSFSVITTSPTRTSKSSSSSTTTKFLTGLHTKSCFRNECRRIHDTTIKKISALYVTPNELWDSYTTALETDPLLVKSITAGIILGAADLAGQVFESNLQNQKQQQQQQDDNTVATDTTPLTIDYGRMIRFGFFGLVLQAPWNHYYYLLLDTQIPPTPNEPFSITNILKIGIDQFIQAPIFTVLIFLFLGLLEGKTIETIQKQLKNDYQSTIIANCKFIFFVLFL